ncbi:MAG: peroxiredoxin [Bacteroidetes bacterium]|nr:peroxiredoxin [Bacteroidota bacterium]
MPRSTTKLKVGDQAPNFTGISNDGNSVSLQDYLGSQVALYFYLKDDTPSCREEARSIRDQWKEFEEAGIVVIGVSGDSVESHRKFTAKYELPFILLADIKKEVIDAYGVWRKGGAALYGKTFLGIKRTTFLIDASGKIVKIFRDPDSKIHGQEILDGFAELDSE